MNFETFAVRPRSTKIALAHLFPRQRWKQWELVGGSVYETRVLWPVVAVHSGLTALTESQVAPGVLRWRFLPQTKMLQINLGSDPKAADVILTYKVCIASAPAILAHDLGEGYEVEYDARLKDIGDLKLELDYENAGIALETQSNITIENTDGFFDDLFDTLIWENQPIQVYSWGLELNPEAARLIFDGFVDQKDFSTSQVKFTLKDQFKRLREKVALPLYSEDDGDLDEGSIGTPKRRIYGRARQVQTVGIQKILDGFALTGTFAGSVSSATVTGTGSDLLDEASPEDEIVWTYQGTEYSATISTVDSDTQLTLADALEVPISGTLTLRPQIAPRQRNRRWHIAGHRLARVLTEVVQPVTSTKFELTSTEDLEEGLIASLAGQFPTIARVGRGGRVSFASSVSGVSAGDPVETNPLQGAYFGQERLIEFRDYLVENTDDDAVLVLSTAAEFNLARPFKTAASFTFTNGSRTVSCATSNLDLKTILKPRDWIRADSLTRPTWFEILQVGESSLVLRTPYSEATFTGNAQRKNIKPIGDDALILVDCNGLEDADGSWIKNASRAIRNLLTSDLGVTNLDEAAFAAAESDAPQLVSYLMPKTLGGEPPVIRDVITDLNRSVFGALYQNASFAFSFSVLHAEKVENMAAIEESDILSYSAKTKGAIFNKVLVNYQPFTDRFTGEASAVALEFENEFVDRISRIQDTLSVNAYLFRAQDAQTYAERLAFLHSVTNSVIEIKGKLNLTNFELGERVILNLDRLYRRYGSSDRLKVALVYLLSTDEGNATLGVNDFNGLFTRAGSIAPNDTLEYGSAEASDVAKYGFIVDNDSETPDGSTNAQLGNNLIS